jgi:hypothetical protein
MEPGPNHNLEPVIIRRIRLPIGLVEWFYLVFLLVRFKHPFTYVKERCATVGIITKRTIMHVWAKRNFRNRTYLYILDQMADQQLTLGAASGLMMVRTGRSEEEEMTTVFIRVPDPTLVATYRGFEKIDERDLPQEAVLLYGDLSEFQKFFRKPSP